jgi:hypothetical protein
MKKLRTAAVARPSIAALDWSARRELKYKRIESGYTSLRVSKLTRDRLKAVQSALPHRYPSVEGFDELLYLMACALLGEKPLASR